MHSALSTGTASVTVKRSIAKFRIGAADGPKKPAAQPVENGGGRPVTRAGGRARRAAGAHETAQLT